MFFPERLKELRNKKGLSQRELAKLLNLSFGAIGMYEIGKREPDYETISKIATFFDVSIDYLIGKSDSSLQWRREYPSGHNAIQKEFEEYVTKQLEGKTPEQQKAEIELAKTALEMAERMLRGQKREE
jgi:transcriptional regulator with XRE-family HTH domain